MILNPGIHPEGRPIFARHPSILFLLTVTYLFLSGCSWIIGPPADNPPARQAVERLSRQNAGLKQFKGLMRMRLQNQTQKISARAAWAIAVPGRLRVELLNTLGQPMTSLASDGQFITIVSHADHSHYRFSQTRTALERLIHLPIGVEELQTLLAGRPPLPAFSAAQGNGETILLKNRWHSTLAKLLLDESGHARTLRVYAEDGALRYQVEWLQWQAVGPYTVPRKLQVDGAEGQRLDMTMDRFWADVKLSPQIFVLEQPAEKY